MGLLEMEAELVGALIGDGYISLASGKYIVGFTGHPRDDADYYVHLSCLAQNVWGKKMVAKVRLRGLRMKIYSKSVCAHLVNDVGLIAGPSKSFSARVPERMLGDWNLLRFVIRGFADTDGSVFCSKKPGVEKYPAIELTTCGLVLAEQLREALLCRGFRVTKLRRYFSALSVRPCYKVCLYGRLNLAKWIKGIGFSNPTKRAKAESFLGTN
jgi:hypothetical protein